MKTLLIELTPDQGKRINSFWKKYGSLGKAMMAQPGNAVNGRYTLLKIGMLSSDVADKIAKLVVKSIYKE